jgi:hypothetical protein
MPIECQSNNNHSKSKKIIDYLNHRMKFHSWQDSIALSHWHDRWQDSARYMLDRASSVSWRSLAKIVFSTLFTWIMFVWTVILHEINSQLTWEISQSCLSLVLAQMANGSAGRARFQDQSRQHSWEYQSHLSFIAMDWKSSWCSGRMLDFGVGGSGFKSRPGHILFLHILEQDTSPYLLLTTQEYKRVQ